MLSTSNIPPASMRIACDYEGGPCNKDFSRSFDMERHKTECHGAPLRCPFCEQTLRRRSRLFEHMELHRGDFSEAQLTCAFCPTATFEAQKMFGHLELHRSRSYGRRRGSSATLQVVHSHSNIARASSSAPRLQSSSQNEEGAGGMSPSIDIDQPTLDKEAIPPINQTYGLERSVGQEIFSNFENYTPDPHPIGHSDINSFPPNEIGQSNYLHDSLQRTSLSSSLSAQFQHQNLHLLSLPHSSNSPTRMMQIPSPDNYFHHSLDATVIPPPAFNSHISDFVFPPLNQNLDQEGLVRFLSSQHPSLDNSSPGCPHCSNSLPNTNIITLNAHRQHNGETSIGYGYYLSPSNV